MATLVLSAVGGAIGASVGGAAFGLSSVIIGKAIGATIGRSIDNSILGGGSAKLRVVMHSLYFHTQLGKNTKIFH